MSDVEREIVERRRGPKKKPPPTPEPLNYALAARTLHTTTHYIERLIEEGLLEMVEVPILHKRVTPQSMARYIERYGHT